jgi:hypothetical protein
MQESYIEGPASHDGPESCVAARKDVDEALTGEHMGGLLSRETRCDQGADAVVLSGRQNDCAQHEISDQKQFPHDS